MQQARHQPSGFPPIRIFGPFNRPSYTYVGPAELSLILAWPVLGAGTRGGGQRVAMSLAVRVDVSATIVAGAKLEGRPHPPAGMCETGVPLLAACRSVSEQKCRSGGRAMQGLDVPKKLLCSREV